MMLTHATVFSDSLRQRSGISPGQPRSADLLGVELLADHVADQCLRLIAESDVDAGHGGGHAAAAAGLYVAMKRRTFASVSGQTRRPDRKSLIKAQSLTASRPKVLSRISCVATNASMSAKRG